MLHAVTNRRVFTGLVVVDTWLRNVDRHSPDGVRQNIRNVFLSIEGAPREHFNVIAMDFTDALPQGNSLNTAFGIDVQHDSRVYGLFPAFAPYIRRRALRLYSERLARITPEQVRMIVDAVPRGWGISHVADRMVRFVVNRAHYLAERICSMITDAMQEEI
jgi:hypothetical protein